MLSLCIQLGIYILCLQDEPGYDFYRDLKVEWGAKGHHNTELFTAEAESVVRQHNTSQPLLLYLAHTAPHAPLQAPQSLVDKFNYIPTRKRRLFAGKTTTVVRLSLMDFYYNLYKIIRHIILVLRLN